MTSTETSKLISEGHESYELMLSMLTGIRTAVSKFASLPLQRALTSADFNQKWDGDFVARGTSETPAHRYADFQFKDYAPLVFRQLRERFGVEAPDYMLSIASEYVLVEMSTNSKSGSFFFYSADCRFILKTCSKREAAFLMAALPNYHAHLMENRFTLLCRFFGLHRVTPRSGKHVYFVVMGNVFPIDRPVHERYDLKGSTLGRETTSAERLEPGVVCKDVDWIKKGRRLHLGADKKRRLLAQVQKDCALLERMEVIDYSLLVGVHQTGAAGGSGAAGRRLHKVGQSGGGNGAAAEEAEAQRRAAVRILDTVSRQQLQEEALRRGGDDLRAAALAERQAARQALEARLAAVRDEAEAEDERLAMVTAQLQLLLAGGADDAQARQAELRPQVEAAVAANKRELAAAMRGVQILPADDGAADPKLVAMGQVHMLGEVLAAMFERLHERDDELWAQRGE